MGPSAERVQWPFKQIWNLLRGESILADDDVILEEIKMTFVQIVQALTLFKRREEDEEKATWVRKNKKPEDKSPDEPTSPKKAPLDNKEGEVKGEDLAESKLRKRISEHLDLEEEIAWELFCSYMMFEYKGGSTSFEKLLEGSRLSTTFLSDLKMFYMQERVCILLCLQALVGHLHEQEHKYYHIFVKFRKYFEKEGMENVGINLLKSLDLARNDEEELECLHSLILLLHQMPHLSIQPFCSNFSGFKPGKKSEQLLKAEAGVMYASLLVSGFETDFPNTFMGNVEQLLENHVETLLLNPYSMGAAVGGFVSACPDNSKVQIALTTCPHKSSACVNYMTQLAKQYSKDSILNRHNLCTSVLKGLYAATKALFDNLDQAIPRFGSLFDYFEFLITALRHQSIAVQFLCEKPEMLDLYCEAMYLFPIDVRWILGMWASMISSSEVTSESLLMLENVTSLLTVVSEVAPYSEFSYPNLQIGYRTPVAKIVAGIEIPPGTEITNVVGLEDGENCLIVWDLKESISPWDIIFHEILSPVINRFKDGLRGSIIEESQFFWSQFEFKNIKGVLQFLVEFASVSSSVPRNLHDLYEPIAFIMLRSIDFVRSLSERSTLASDLINLVNAANKFGEQAWTLQYLDSIWPNPAESSNLIEDVIMGYESVANNDCRVTLAFLKSVLAFFKEDEHSGMVLSPSLKWVAFRSVSFINDNVFHSYTRWRMESEEVKFKILLGCLKVYNCAFSIADPDWTPLKNACVKSLLASNSSLMAGLGTDEDLLQKSVVKPQPDFYLLPEVIYHSLSLLLKIFEYQKQAIKMVDTSLGLTLVQKLGRFARHRLDYKIPTLAMALLKKIAEELNMSLLSCFGNDEVAFRDLISQRLEFRSEDINLKVAILEFLTIAAHTQPGLIQYLFMDDYLPTQIIQLPKEREEGLALSVLIFLRALFRKGATVMKKCKSLWPNLFLPLTLLNLGGRVKIITCTLNIAAIELFHNGVSDHHFVSELKKILEKDEIIRIFEIALSDKTDLGIRCLLSVKHFLQIVINRNDLKGCLTDGTKREILDMASTQFWEVKETGVSEPRIAVTLVELMCLLATSIGEYPEFLDNLAERLVPDFFNDCVAVQISLLSLTNSCLRKSATPIQPKTVENVVRVVCRVFSKAASVYESEESETVFPILTISAAIICTIMKSNSLSSDLEHIFEHHILSKLIVSVANLGICSGKGPDVVIECLNVMIRLAESHVGARMLYFSDVTDKVLTSVMQYASPEPREFAWEKVYLLCTHLASVLLTAQGHFFLSSSLDFWGLHGTYLVHKLWALSEMTKHCLMNNPEHNFQLMKNLLTFNAFVLDAVSAMIPFYSDWKLQQGENLNRVLEGVFTALQTSINLLNQPHYLQVLISFAKSVQPPHLEQRLTPQLLELQHKLWDVIYLGCHIYWKLRHHSRDLIESEIILGTVNQIAQTCLKGMTTKADRKGQNPAALQSQTSISASTSSDRTVVILEKSLSLYHYHAKLTLEESGLSTKQQLNFKREISSDIGTICDSIRRVGTSQGKSNFLSAICISLENTFK